MVVKLGQLYRNGNVVTAISLCSNHSFQHINHNFATKGQTVANNNKLRVKHIDQCHDRIGKNTYCIA